MALSESTRVPSRPPPVMPNRWRLAAITPSSQFYWARLVLENPAALASLCFVFLMVIVALFAPRIASFDPNFVNPADRLQGPSAEYWFGTDDLGRDVFSRVIYGARISASP
jgi:peptide/nickel transport system permease protein